jgi:hypothetical protein
MSAAVVTAIDWQRHNNPAPERVPTTPVGPDLAVGLSQDFGFDAFAALDWETALEVNILLEHGGRGPLPARGVVALGAENRARADVAGWPNLSDYGYDR